MTMVGMTGARHEAEAEHRHRMAVNLVAAGFITLLMVSAYWVVSTLSGIVL
jgi:hypothetical protein